MNHRTFSMDAATPCVKVVIRPCKYMRKVSNHHLPIILIVCSGIPARCRVIAPSDCKEWDLILCVWKPSFQFATYRVSVT